MDGNKLTSHVTIGKKSGHGTFEGDDGKCSFLLSSNRVWKDRDIRRTGFCKAPTAKWSNSQASPINCQIYNCTVRTEVSLFHKTLLARRKQYWPISR